ncbi:MAG TPA: hypothetical protein VFV93_02920, partial [Thermomicrobiales bacterium]|nr:hypothetical protein [Thermomicrobiales bacterium]
MSDQRALVRTGQSGILLRTDQANPRVVRGLARLDGQPVDRFNLADPANRYEASFPDDRAIGHLFALDDDGYWKELGEATGTVHLPVRRFLRFENGHLPLASADLDLIEPLQLLRDVRLTGKEITDDGLDRLSGLRALRVLALLYTATTDAGLATISHLSTLHDLDIRASQLTDNGLARLRDLSELQSLALAHAPIGRRGAVQIGDLRQLRRLSLHDVPLGDD